MNVRYEGKRLSELETNHAGPRLPRIQIYPPPPPYVLINLCLIFSLKIVLHITYWRMCVLLTYREQTYPLKLFLKVTHLKYV
jgi:hypothetical protein